MSQDSATVGDRIEREIANEHWAGARKLITAELRKDPDSHWLLTRLSLTYYEQRNYAKALELTTRALSLAPFCPLVLWNHAGTLDMLGRTEAALATYQRILKRGVDRIAHGTCGEGLAKARGLVADSWYRSAHCYRALKKTRQAIGAYNKHLAMRGPGCRSIYDLRAVRQELNDLTSRRARG